MMSPRDKSGGNEGAPSSLPQGEPPRDLYATSDIRLVLIELGHVKSSIETLSAAVHDHGTKIDDLRLKVAFTKGALWVIGVLGLFVIPFFTWLLNHSFPASSPAPIIVAQPPAVTQPVANSPTMPATVPMQGQPQ